MAPVSPVAKIANVLAVRKSLPARNVQELYRLRQGRYGASSPTAHRAPARPRILSGAQHEGRADIQMVHVPYRGTAPAINDLIAGHIDMFFDTITTAVPLHEAGRVRVLAVAGPERAPTVPDFPTIAESLPGFRSITWFAMVGPPKLPAALAAKINRDVVDILQSDAMSAKLREMRLDAMIGTPEDAKKFFDEETELWGNVIKEAKVTVQ